MSTIRPKWVSVKRNIRRDSEQTWLVYCVLCAGQGPDFFGLLASLHKPLGGSPDWRTAQDFAAHHALLHEQTRCQSCLHVPEHPLIGSVAHTEEPRR